MGEFGVTVGVGHPHRGDLGGDLAEVSAMVDTGANHSMMPESLLTQMRVQPLVERSIGFADGRREKLGVGQARIAYQGEEWVCLVIFGPEDQYLLGSTTLEAFELAVDPSSKRLVPAEYIARPF